MTTKFLYSFVSSYYMISPLTTLSITNDGTVGYRGVSTDTVSRYTVVNEGTIDANNYVQRYTAVHLGKGGVVTNGSNGNGLLTNKGNSAVVFDGYKGGVDIAGGAGTVSNYASIIQTSMNSPAYWDVRLEAGGVVTNGAPGITDALLQGRSGVILSGAGVVNNFGRIKALGVGQAYGVVLSGGGALTNGSNLDQVASITGDTAVRLINVAGTVTNFGLIASTGGGSIAGVALQSGGKVTNGSGLDTVATISGDNGVYTAGAASMVNNFGTVLGLGPSGYGVLVNAGGVVRNGSTADQRALIEGYDVGVGALQINPVTVANFGAIASVGYQAGDAGVSIYAGNVINGAGADHNALISGYFGAWIQQAAGTVTNFGTILGQGAAESGGVILSAGGAVRNGDLSDIQALISGGSGVAIYGAAGAVTNQGTIDSTVGSETAVGGYGVRLGAGGGLTNGAYSNHAALVEGYGAGVSVAGGAGTIHNFGLIRATGGLNAYTPANGIELNAGGLLINGAPSDRLALVEGYSAGVSVAGAAATIENFAVIRATGGAGAYGVELKAGGLLLNDDQGFIEGYGGVVLNGVATAFNYGTIQASDLWGVVVAGAGGTLTNGAGPGASALIKGLFGATIEAANATMTNFGTVVGTSGTSVVLDFASDTLVVEAGSAFVGAVTGNGGTLELATGTGTLTGLFSAGGNVTVSGSMATTTFNDFGTVKIDAPGSFTLVGNGAIAAGQTLVDAGTLAGTGTLALTGGTSTFNTGAALTVAKVTEAVTATVTVATNLTYAGVFTQSAGTVSVSAGDKLSFSGAGDSFLGTLAGAGTVAFTGGTDALTGTTLKGTSVQIGAATVTLSGAISNASAIAVTSPSVIIAAAGATLSGTGSINLSNLATNEITGAATTATLTNVSNKITGAGLLGGGKMTLINQAGGTIYGNQATALTIDTGAATIANAGIIENTGTGGTIVKSAINNTGTLEAIAGTITLDGAVTGSGTVRITAGTADFVSTFAENVAFAAGSTGTLELGKSTTYTGSISGFSKTGTNFLDLADIAFISGTTKATFSGTTTSGVLTVTDGTHTAKITLTGNYLSSTFVVATDGHGGTLVHDPAKTAASAPPTHSPPFSTGPAPLVPFIGAMAGFGAGNATASTSSLMAPLLKPAILASPHASVA